MATEKTEKNNKKSHSLGWIVGVVLLLLISLAFIIPSTGLRSSANSIVFGSYKGNNIELSYGNYFYNQLAALSAQYPDVDSFSLYFQAYYNTVFETALKSYAKEAGIKITDSVINETIKTSLLDESGNYDSALYKDMSELERSVLKDNITDALPAQMAYSDILSVKSSRAERDFVTSLSDYVRDFEYYIIDYTYYGDSDAILYARENSNLFLTAPLSSISFETEEEALAFSGEEFTNSALDTYYYSLERDLRDTADASIIFSLSEGEISPPVSTWFGWTVYKMEGVVKEADLTNSETLSTVKSYISAYESASMDEYLSSLSDEIYSALLLNEVNAQNRYNLKKITVAPSSPNPSLSRFIIGLEYTDQNGALQNAAKDPSYSALLFTSEYDTFIPPVKSGQVYIIAKSVESAEDNKTLSTYITSLYDSAMPTITSQDLYSAIFTSDDFSDNFFSVYFNLLYGST